MLFRVGMSRCSGCDNVAVPGSGSGGVSDVSPNKVTDDSSDNSDPRVIVGRGLPVRRSGVTVFPLPTLLSPAGRAYSFRSFPELG